MKLEAMAFSVCAGFSHSFQTTIVQCDEAALASLLMKKPSHTPSSVKYIGQIKLFSNGRKIYIAISHQKAMPYFCC